MASSKPFNCVAHCSSVEFHAVNALATRIINLGIYLNTTLFTTPVVALLFFKGANDELTRLIGVAKGNKSFETQRNEQSIVVHNFILQLIAYANPICAHDLNKIDQSGFDASNVPVPTVIPGIPNVKYITEKNQLADHYKAVLVKNKKKTLITARPAMQHKGTRYTAASSTNPTGPFITRIEGVASTKIIFTGLTPNVKNYIIIYGVNSKGKGPACAPFPFTPQ